MDYQNQKLLDSYRLVTGSKYKNLLFSRLLKVMNIVPLLHVVATPWAFHFD
jgi:hypothetical protein